MSGESFITKANKVLESFSNGDFSGKPKFPGETDEDRIRMASLLEKLRESLIEIETREKSRQGDTSQFERIFNEVPTPLIATDRKFGVTYLNNAATKMVGRKKEECIGKKCHELFKTSHCGTDSCCLAQAFEKDGTFTAEAVARPDGADIPIKYSCSPLKNPEGGIIGGIEYVFDITESKKILRDLADSKSFLDNILQSSTRYSIIGKDLNHRILSWNEGAQRNYGYTASEIIGRDSGILHTPEDMKSGAVSRLLEESHEKGIAEGEFERVRKDGSRFMASVVVTRRNDSSGHPIGYLLMSSDITEKKLSEGRLKQASQYARSLIEASLDPLVTISPDGKIMDVNEATVKATGYSREELAGTDFSDYFTEPERAQSVHKQVFAKGNVTDYPLTIRHKGERLLDVLFNASAYRDLGGNILGVLATARDVTEQKRIMEELETQNWLRSGQTELNDRIRGELDTAALAKNTLSFLCKFLNMQVGAFYVNRDGALRLFSSYAYMKRKNISNVYAPGEGLVGQAALEKEPFLISNVPPDYIAITSGLGEASPRNILITPFMFQNQVKGVIELGAFYEITERQLQFMKTVSDGIAIAFDSADARTAMKELLERTQTQAEELQAQAEELQAQQEELRLANDQLQEQTRILSESEEKLKAQQEELQIANEELEEQQAVVEGRNTELQRAQIEIAEKAKQLELTSGYKTEFISNMSHELRTPLNSILILTKMLEDNEEGNIKEGQLESLRVVHNSACDLLSLINQILDLSKVESGKIDIHREKVYIADVVRSLEKSSAPVAHNKGLTFSVVVNDGIPETILSDRMKIEQVLKNLVSNATKFTDEGGVTVTLGRPAPDAVLAGGTLDPRATIAFAVSDTGAGIPKGRQKHLFEAFQQAHSEHTGKFGGTGLGLYISRKLARLLGGEIELSSTPGKGSCFTFLLPEASQLPVETEAPPASKIDTVDAVPVLKQYEIPQTVGKLIIPDDRDSIGKDDRTVLIIEDDANFAKILADIAQRKGFKRIVAGDGETGLILAGSYKPDAIILDLILPGIDGWVVIERLKAAPELRHIPVHIISALEERLQALTKGAIGFTGKPTSKEQLYAAFEGIEKFVAARIKKLLIIEDDERTRSEIVELLRGNDIEILEVANAGDAYKMLKKQVFDCIVLDLILPDMSGFELLEKMKDEEMEGLPVIIYTAKELTREEDNRLREFTESVIVKDVRSPERLIDEVSLFLHRMESTMGDGQKKMIRMVHDREAILKDKRILVVDDDMRNTYALSKLLRDKGMKVAMAEDGKKALEALESDQDFNLVMMDIMMPRMDGYECMRKIRSQERFTKLPIIALTANVMKGDREQCIKAGANDYLAKPVDVEKLLSMLRVWLYK